MDPATPQPSDLHPREEAVLRAIEAHDRMRERAFRHRLTIVVVLVLPVIVVALGLLAIGSQHHVLEIRDGDAVARLVSREAPYSIDVPGWSEVPDVVGGGFGGVIRDRVEGTSVEPRMYDAATYARTTQVVRRDEDDVTPLDFLINGRQFRLVGRELQSGAHRWLLRPGRILEINVDALPRVVMPPVAAPRGDDDDDDDLDDRDYDLDDDVRPRGDGR